MYIFLLNLLQIYNSNYFQLIINLITLLTWKISLLFAFNLLFSPIRLYRALARNNLTYLENGTFDGLTNLRAL